MHRPNSCTQCTDARLAIGLKIEGDELAREMDGWCICKIVLLLFKNQPALHISHSQSLINKAVCLFIFCPNKTRSYILNKVSDFETVLTDMFVLVISLTIRQVLSTV